MPGGSETKPSRSRERMKGSSDWMLTAFGGLIGRTLDDAATATLTVTGALLLVGVAPRFHPWL